MKKIPFIFVLCVLASCTLQKRNYRQGYYLSWSKSHEKNKETVLPEKTAVIDLTADASEKSNLPVQKENKSSFLLEKKSVFRLPPDTCVDMIYFEDGTECLVKDIEITEWDVNYRRCDDPKKQLITKAQDKILMIKYANGSVKGFKSESYSVNKSEAKVNAKAILALGLAVWSWISLFLGIFNTPMLLTSLVSFILGIVLSVKARKEIKRDPGKYKGLWIANLAMVICLLLPVAIALIIVALV